MLHGNDVGRHQSPGLYPAPCMKLDADPEAALYKIVHLWGRHLSMQMCTKLQDLLFSLRWVSSITQQRRH